MGKHLISALHKSRAEHVARKLKIGNKDWIFVPVGMGAEADRERALAGKHGYTEDRLHGYFSNAERILLLSRQGANV